MPALRGHAEPTAHPTATAPAHAPGLDHVDRVVVAVAGAPGSDRLIRVAAGLAERSGAELVAVHVQVPGRSAGVQRLDDHRRLVAELGGSWHQLQADSVASALRRFAGGGRTNLVLGATRRPRWRELATGSVLDQLTRDADFDVHVVTPEPSLRGPARWQAFQVSRSRRRVGWALGIVGVPLLTAILVPWRSEDAVSASLLLFVLLTVAVATIGGAAPAIAVAIAGFFAANWFLTPPFHTLEVSTAANLIALFSFLAVAAVVSVLVGQAARRSADAARATAETEALAREQARLQAEAARATALVETDRLRTALLRAVSHDLRTPLASIKASVSSLLQHDVDWSPEETEEFLVTIEEETDRLDRVVGNLLDMGRLQAGAVTTARRTVGLEEIVLAALTSLSGDTSRVSVLLDERSPQVVCDPALLERAVANVLSNALAWAPEPTVITVDASASASTVELRVVDRGPGVPPDERERLFEPFQRLGDRSNDIGAGLGLAVARGFIEAMGGTIGMDDTPGGGLTMVITLDRAPT